MSSPSWQRHLLPPRHLKLAPVKVKAVQGQPLSPLAAEEAGREYAHWQLGSSSLARMLAPD